MIVLALLLGNRAIAAARPPAIVTILQGNATAIRAVSQFSLAEGVRLLPDDLLRTDKNTFLRIEYEDGTWLELGPETQLQLAYPTDRRAKAPALYLMSGWLKLGAPAAEGGAKRSLASPSMELNDITGTLVIHAIDASHSIFVEQGSAHWVDRAPRATDNAVIGRGEFLVTGKGKSPQVQSRPAPDFVAALPLQYRDTLPARYALFASRNVAIKEPHAFAYADVEPWVNAELPERRQFIQWWRHKAAQEPDFRAALDHSMSMHPEWDPVLHPEKYEKDDAPPVKPTT